MKFKFLKTLTLASVLTGALTISAFAASQGAATVQADLLNLRSEPHTTAPVIASAPQGAAVVISQRVADNWYRVVYRGRLGYMSGDFLSYSETLEADIGRGVIVGSDVRVRDAASLSSNIVGIYQNGTEMQVLGVYKDWYKVKAGDNIGFVFSDFFGLRTDLPTGGNSGETPSSGIGQQLVDAAMKYLDVPYVWAGTSPNGFDCSGFVHYVYKELGYSINRTAASIYENGSYVEKSQLQPGDPVCFTNSGSGSSIGHVGIYIGNDQFIHASSSARKVIISKLSDDYYIRNYVGARRIV